MDNLQPENLGMSLLGWIIFLFSNGVVIALVCFCFYRVLTIPREHMHAPLDIDTKDLEDDENSENEDDKNN